MSRVIDVINGILELFADADIPAYRYDKQVQIPGVAVGLPTFTGWNLEAEPTQGTIELFVVAGPSEDSAEHLGELLDSVIDALAPHDYSLQEATLLEVTHESGGFPAYLLEVGL